MIHEPTATAAAPVLATPSTSMASVSLSELPLGTDEDAGAAIAPPVPPFAEDTDGELAGANIGFVHAWLGAMKSASNSDRNTEAILRWGQAPAISERCVPSNPNPNFL